MGEMAAQRKEYTGYKQQWGVDLQGAARNRNGAQYGGNTQDQCHVGDVRPDDIAQSYSRTAVQRRLQTYNKLWRGSAETDHGKSDDHRA